MLVIFMLKMGINPHFARVQEVVVRADVLPCGGAGNTSDNLFSVVVVVVVAAAAAAVSATLATMHR